MRCKGRVALLVAITTAVWCGDAQADTDSQGRTVADIVNEARARVERLSWEPPKRKADTEKRGFYGGERGLYMGLGVESYGPPVDAMYRIRAAQRAEVPIQHLRAVSDKEINSNPYTYNFFVGYEFARWLGLELTLHSLDSDSQWITYTPAVDPTLAGANEVEARQYGLFKERTYSISLVPRWKISKHIALHGRLGLGYAENSFRSEVTSSGWISRSQQCDADGVTNCRSLYETIDRELSFINEKYTGFFPIGALGVQLFDGLVNVEYMYRFNEPMAEKDINHGSIYVRFLVRFRWF